MVSQSQENRHISDFRSSNLYPNISSDRVKGLFTGHRTYHNLVTRDVPIYLVNGNHEMQSGFDLDGTSENVALWGARNRLKYYPNPRPSSFYSGNTVPQEFIDDGGLMENYYSWTWGDALFVVLDDYWYAKSDCDWTCSFGWDQFNWLKQMLTNSKAKYKFVFHHHLHCTSRGGVEVAKEFEWGGYERDGKTWGYPTNRPTWGNVSIHQMFVQNNVTIVFQGHDHLHANQVLDGVRYLTVPMPAFNPATYLIGTNNNADAFPNGKVVRPSGHVTVEVSPRGLEAKYYFVGMTWENGWNNMDLGDSFVIPG